MQYFLEHFGVGVAAITGVLAARGKGVDLFGVVVLAVVTAFGGGTLRDLMVGDTPVFWVRDPNYLLTAAAVAVVAFFAARFYEIPGNVLQVADAFALALFTMIGVKKALAFQVAPSIALAMGVVTGVVGGIIRDMLAGEIPLVFRPAIYLYATAAFCGAVVFLFLQRWSLGEHSDMILAASVTLLLRFAAIRWKLGLPVFRHREEGR